MDLNIAKHVLELFQRGPSAEEQREAKLWWEIQLRIVAAAVTHRARKHTQEEQARWTERANRLAALRAVIAAARTAEKEPPPTALTESDAIMREIELEALAALDAN